MENLNNGDPIPIIDEWCSGFIKGVLLDSDGWLPVVIGKPDWMSTITLYGTEDGWKALEKKNLSLDEHKALAAGLAGTVQKIYGWWLEERGKQIAGGTWPDVVRRDPIRNPNKVGRNEPCPCGSGKKFKQCHGSADPVALNRAASTIVRPVFGRDKTSFREAEIAEAGCGGTCPKGEIRRGILSPRK